MLRTVTVLLIITLACALVGCKQPAAEPPMPEAPAVQTPPAPEPPAAEAPAEAPKAEATKEKTMGPKLEGEEGKEIKTTESGLKYLVLEAGSGEKPKQGATVVAEYTGWLTDGTKFDSSKDHPGDFSFPVGQGQVIPGWDEALLDMKVGERRKLIVPADLAYGDQAVGGVIPANSTLIFEVKLVKIQ